MVGGANNSGDSKFSVLQTLNTTKGHTVGCGTCPSRRDAASGSRGCGRDLRALRQTLPCPGSRGTWRPGIGGGPLLTGSVCAWCWQHARPRQYPTHSDRRATVGPDTPLPVVSWLLFLHVAKPRRLYARLRAHGARAVWCPGRVQGARAVPGLRRRQVPGWILVPGLCAGHVERCVGCPRRRLLELPAWLIVAVRERRRVRLRGVRAR